MHIKMVVILYLCHLFEPCDPCGCFEIQNSDICNLTTLHPHCNFNACTCDNCKPNASFTGKDFSPDNLLDILAMKNVNCLNQICIKNYILVTSGCENCNCICTMLNCTDSTVPFSLTFTEKTVEDTTPMIVRPSPHLSSTGGNNITTTTATAFATLNEIKDFNRFNSTTLNSTENPAYYDSESDARRQSILIGLIVGMVVLFILLLITIIVILRLRSRAKTKESKANKSPQLSTLTEPQKTLINAIQTLEKYEDGNIYHQLDNVYGDSKQISQYKTMLNSTDIFSQSMEALGNDLQAESVRSSIMPTGSKETFGDNSTIVNTTYFILEEDVSDCPDVTIAENVDEGSYFILENDIKLESSTPPDAALPSDSVSRLGGYSRFGDITRKATNGYNTFVEINEENIGIEDKTVDDALQTIATGERSDQKAIYVMPKPPITEESVLNTEEKIYQDTHDIECLNF